ncbi:MAG TPA: SAF domain-containing protein, partial [Candidatus Rifleibacterium sp.]|nr:SAF domain-containing protein [Candidatus Rifleibacterium sp.]
ILHPYSSKISVKEMVEAIRQTEKILGSPVKQHSAAETELHRIARRSLVAAVKIARGTTISEELIAVKRPGFGIPVRHMQVVIGRTAKIDIDEDDILTWEMI